MSVEAADVLPIVKYFMDELAFTIGLPIMVALKISGKGKQDACCP